MKRRMTFIAMVMGLLVLLGATAVVAQDDCTTIVLPGFSVRADAYANLRITQASRP